MTGLTKKINLISTIDVNHASAKLQFLHAKGHGQMCTKRKRSHSENKEKKKTYRKVVVIDLRGAGSKRESKREGEKSNQSRILFV